MQNESDDKMTFTQRLWMIIRFPFLLIVNMVFVLFYSLKSNFWPRISSGYQIVSSFDDIQWGNIYYMCPVEPRGNVSGTVAVFTAFLHIDETREQDSDILQMMILADDLEGLNKPDGRIPLFSEEAEKKELVEFIRKKKLYSVESERIINRLETFGLHHGIEKWEERIIIHKALKPDGIYYWKADEEESKLIGKIKNKNIEYEDLLYFPDVVIMKILLFLDSRDLYMAFTDSSHDLQQKILSSLGNFTAECLMSDLDDIEMRSKISKNEAREKQEEILKIFFNLLDNGSIRFM